MTLARRRRRLPRAAGARRALRRAPVRRRHLDRRLLPAGLPRAPAAARELPLLRQRRRRPSAAASGPACAAGPNSAPGLVAGRFVAARWRSRRRACSSTPRTTADDVAAAADRGHGWASPTATCAASSQAAHGVTPIDYLTTQRLLLAKQLLTDTAPAGDAGRAGQRLRQPAPLQRGVRRALPAEPDAAAPQQRGAIARAGSATLARPRAARWPTGRRTTSTACSASSPRARVAGVEAVDARTTLAAHARARHRGGASPAGWRCASLPERHEVEADASRRRSRRRSARVVQRLRQRARPRRRPGRDRPGAGRRCRGRRAGMRVPGGVDGFEIAVRVILGQQVTVAAARTLDAAAGRALRRADRDTVRRPDRAVPVGRGARRAPTPTHRRAGHRAPARRRAAGAGARGRTPAASRCTARAPLAATLDALRALPGIGDWTAQLIAMRALAWPDAFPASDIGVLNALGTRDAQGASPSASEAWRPWRSYAVMRLWQHPGDWNMTTTLRKPSTATAGRAGRASTRRSAR